MPRPKLRFNNQNPDGPGCCDLCSVPGLREKQGMKDTGMSVCMDCFDVGR